MTFDAARRALDELWAEANRREEETKGAYAAVDAVKRRLINAPASERPMLERAVASWVATKDEAKLYDALALITELKITSALPEMKRLRRKFRLLPWKRDDFEMVDDSIRDLERRT